MPPVRSAPSRAVLSTASAARRSLRALADPARAAFNARFFRTGSGEYGEGDRFLGLTVPQIREVARSARALPLPEIGKLLASPMHEQRFLALVILVERGRRASPPERDELAEFYLAHLDRVNNWDLVDVSAPGILGPYFEARPRAALRKLARSPNLWHRRVAMLTTFHFIRKGEVEEALAMAERLRDDPHDLIHKAVGWMLREIGERDPQALEAFLDAHAARMPRTMLRYAIEKVPAAKRRVYLNARARPRLR